ncbi:2Fe-2S iron-sulfur cluster-binding protein [Streptomyces sp. NPDC053427]|uniref:2Fe-2S iron-sulfur cluster-binding protein n=1 Tax=Streptomyces sp. NPDC053427 TaxID=3365701 RepID=UPI0037D1E7C8
MSDDNHTPQQPHPEQGWQPLPQGGEYESEATAFVQLPEGFTTGVYGGVPGRYGSGYGNPGADPLAAPGHGYTPPSSFAQHAAAPPVPDAGTDPASTGQWTMPFADPSAGYVDPSAGYPAHSGHTDHSGHAGHQDSAAIYQGGAPEAAQPWGGDRVDWPVAGSAEAAGAWSVPAAADDGLEESGEYLVGEDGLPGHQGHQGYQGHQGHQGQAGHHPGPGGAADYQGGYQDTYGGAEVPADSGEAGRTGHWNFTAGLSATTGVPGQGGTAADDPFRAPAGDPYAASHPADGLTDGSTDGLADGGEAVDGDPYGTGVGRTDAPAAGATGHWSLPADALAQWPPAQQEPTPRPEEAAPSIGAGSGADRWAVPVAEGEQPDHSGEFAVGPATGPGAGEGAGAGEAYGTYQAYGAYEEPRAAAEDRPADGDERAAGESAATEPEPGPEPESAAVGAPSPAEGQDAHHDVHHDLPRAADPVDPAAPAGPTEPTELTELTGGLANSTGHAGPETTPDPTGTPDPTDPTDPTAPVPDTLAPAGAADEQAHDEHPAASYVLRVNGTDRPVTDSWIGESLLYVLRERLGLAGAKDGCSQGECGACSVQVDGRLVASCLVPAATTAGSEVRTVEGLAQDGVPSDVQRALAASGAVQCGFCIPGMAMTVHDLLEGNHAPSELETRKALCGNLCRCSGYRGVLDAVEEVVKARTEAAEAAHAEDRTPPDAPMDKPRIPHQAGPSDPTGHAPHHQDSPGHHPQQGPGADPQTGGAA